jgi:hypothetical protein
MRSGIHELAPEHPEKPTCATSRTPWTTLWRRARSLASCSVNMAESALPLPARPMEDDRLALCEVVWLLAKGALGGES